MNEYLSAQMRRFDALAEAISYYARMAYPELREVDGRITLDLGDERIIFKDSNESDDIAIERLTRFNDDTQKSLDFILGR